MEWKGLIEKELNQSVIWLLSSKLIRILNVGIKTSLPGFRGIRLSGSSYERCQVCTWLKWKWFSVLLIGYLMEFTLRILALWHLYSIVMRYSWQIIIISSISNGMWKGKRKRNIGGTAFRTAFRTSYWWSSSFHGGIMTEAVRLRVRRSGVICVLNVKRKKHA